MRPPQQRPASKPMRVFVVEPPASVVTWDDANRHLRLDGDISDKDYVESLIAAATGSIDGPQGWLGRALGPQTLEARFDRFDRCDAGIRLPYGPIIDIVSIQYVDGDGVIATIDAGAYEIAGDVVSPVFGGSWPSAAWRSEAVRVRYRAGYVADPTADPLVPALPAPIKAAILLMLGDLYTNRQTTAVGTATGIGAIPMSLTVQSLLSPFRVWF